MKCILGVNAGTDAPAAGVSGVTIGEISITIQGLKFMISFDPLSGTYFSTYCTWILNLFLRNDECRFYNLPLKQEF